MSIQIAAEKDDAWYRWECTQQTARGELGLGTQRILPITETPGQSQQAVDRTDK